MSAAMKAQPAARPFLKLHYDFFDMLTTELTLAESRLALVIYRETVGWNRETVTLSYTDLEEKTGLCRRVLKKLLLALKQKGIIKFCDQVGRWGAHVYALAKRWITGEEEQESIAPNAIIQRPFPGDMAQNAIVVWNEMPQNSSTECHSSVEPCAIEPARQPAPEAAWRVPKEIFKESSKENIIERNAVEEVTEEQEEEPCAPEWTQVLEGIEKRVTHATFLSWFAGSRAFKTSDKFIIEVATSFHKRYIHRYYREIQALLEPLLPASMEIFVATPEERRCGA